MITPNPLIRHFLLPAVIAVVCLVQPVAGDTTRGAIPSVGWTNAPWTSDADSGITNAYPYHVAVNFGSTAVFVNAVLFQGTAASGPSFGVGGIINTTSDSNSNSSSLARNFIFGGFPRTVTISNLVPNVRYQATFFSVGWNDDAQGRTQLFASAVDTLVLNQDIYGDNQGVKVSYTFDGSTNGVQQFSMTPLRPGYSFHMYAMAVAYLGSPQGADMLWFGPGAVIAGTNIAWTLPYGSNAASLTPVFSLSEGATCDRNSGDVTDFTSPVKYTVVSADSVYTNVYTVTVAVLPVSTGKSILSFGPGAVIAGRDIRWLVPAGSDVTTLAPTYTISPLATGYPAAGATNDFTTPRTYTVVAQDLSSNIYTVTAVVATPGWTYAPWTSDADSGITNAYPYHVAVNLASTGAYVNDVFFQASATSGSNFVIGGTAAVINNDANNVNSSLARDFIYGASPRTVVISSLTPGTRYKTTFFSVGWEAAGRTQTFNAGGGDVTVLDQDMYGNNNGIKITHQFEVDASGSKTFTITQFGTVGSFHTYALAVASLGSWQGADILTFGPGAVIAGTNIAWTVPYGTDVTTLAHVFSLSEGATCDRTSGDVVDFTSPVTYTVVSADSLYTNVYTVTVTVTPASSGRAILTFGIPGNTGIIVGTDIALSVPYGTAVSMLAPTYTVSPFATSTPPSGSTNDFTTPVTYTVTAQDLSTRDYTVTVTMRPEPTWPITNGMSVWLKADAINTSDTSQVRTVDTNVYVKQWTDQSGNGQHASQADPTNQPEYLAESLNGYPTLYWDGSITNKSMSGPGDTTLKTIFFVCKVDTNRTTYDGILCRSPNQDLQNIRAYAKYWRAYGVNAQDYCYTGSVYVNSVKTNLHNDAWHILREVSGSTPTFTYQLGQKFMSRYFDGRIAEFIAYNRALNDDEVLTVETYLARKYWGGVYITNDPFTVTAGDNIVIAGTNNAAIVGDMWISNAANDQVAVFTAPSPADGWVSPVVPSVYGNNPVWVYGTNSEGHVAADVIMVAGVPEPTTAGAVVAIGYWLFVIRRRRSAACDRQPNASA